MASSYNPTSYFQGGQYERNAPTGKHYQSANTLNNITPISHQINVSPPKQYGGYGGGLNILSPQSTYKQYQFGEFTSAAGQKDLYPPSSSYASNNQNAFSYNKPFAPPSSQNGPVTQFVGSKSYLGGTGDAQYNQFSANTGPKPFNDLDFELNKAGGPNKYPTSTNTQTMFNQKKYAFEQSSPSKSNYFNIDKYFENFKDPLENIDISAKTIPKSYGVDKSAPVYSNSTTLNQGGRAPMYQAPSNIPVNKYALDPIIVASTTFAAPSHNRDKSEEKNEIQSRVIIDQRSNIPVMSQHIGESIYIKRDKNRSLVDFQIKNPSYNQPDTVIDNLNKSTSYLPQPSFNFSVEQSTNIQPKQANRYDQVLEKSHTPTQVNFDLTLPFPDNKGQDKQKQIQQLQSQQQQPQQPQQQQRQNFFKEYHEQKNQKTEQSEEISLFKSKEYYDQFIQHQRQQKEMGFQQYQQNLQEQQFNHQLQQYLKQQSPNKSNILEKFEQKNNKLPQNPYKSKSIAIYEKIRSKMQSQTFLNKIQNELESDQVYFVKFLVEQITIDSELDQTRDNILKSTEFSLQTLFNFFDKKKKSQIDITSFFEGLDSLSIPYIKTYVQKIFTRFTQEDNKYLRYCDFVELFTQNGKQTTWNQIFSFVGPKNGVAKEQKKQFAIIKRQSSNLSEEQKKLISQLFSHLVNIEKSIQSFKDMQGDEDILYKIFRILDKKQKGFLVINDFLDFLNNKGGDYEREEFLGLFKRLNFAANSGRINFYEFLTFFQRDVVVQPPPEQKLLKEKQNEEELKPIKILKEPNMPGFKKVSFKGKQKKVQE